MADVAGGGANSPSNPSSDLPVSSLEYGHSDSSDWSTRHPEWFDHTWHNGWLSASWIGGVATSALAYYCLHHGWILVASILLVVPLAILLGSLSFSQYHRYRSEVQALIDGKLDRQKAADQATQAAAGKKAESAAIDALSKKIDDEGKTVGALKDDVDTRLTSLDNSVKSLQISISVMSTSLVTIASHLSGSTPPPAAPVAPAPNPTKPPGAAKT